MELTRRGEGDGRNLRGERTDGAKLTGSGRFRTCKEEERGENLRGERREELTREEKREGTL